jgi:hypothetical protein
VEKNDLSQNPDFLKAYLFRVSPLLKPLCGARNRYCSQIGEAVRGANGPWAIWTFANETSAAEDPKCFRLFNLARKCHGEWKLRWSEWKFKPWRSRRLVCHSPSVAELPLTIGAIGDARITSIDESTRQQLNNAWALASFMLKTPTTHPEALEA